MYRISPTYPAGYSITAAFGCTRSTGRHEDPTPIYSSTSSIQ